MLSRQLKKMVAAKPPISLLPASQRGYFSFMDRVRETVHAPMRHIKAFMEPEGQQDESQLPDGYRTHGNTAAHFGAYLTHNALEMHQWHEMEATVHSQFGTVDNPVLIFTSDSSWRIVICMGPGIEDDSHSHEKMYYFVREGPMHRCHICGQCFKLVRLKRGETEENEYYASMFASITHFEVAEEDLQVGLTSYFGDRPSPSLQTINPSRLYVRLNNDQMDRVMVDPAFKLEKYAQAQEKVYALGEAFRQVQSHIAPSL